MVSLKLVRSLVFGETINDSFLLRRNQKPHHSKKNAFLGDDNGDVDEDDDEDGTDYPCLIFLPTNEVIQDTSRLAAIARDMGMNFIPDPSLSTLLFSWPSSSSPIVSLSFPFLSFSPVSHIRRFIRISKGLFKLSCSTTSAPPAHKIRPLSLFVRVTGHPIKDIEDFSHVLASSGWCLFKSGNGHLSSSSSASVVEKSYVFRKVDANRVGVGWWRGGVGPSDEDFGGRVRELRLPALDFRNAPLRVLLYILLMTDDLFYLA